MMKNRFKSALQKVFGFKTYLFVFSLYSIRKALKGNYEKEFDYFISLVPDKGLILDIGANIGITAIPLAKAKKNAVVHAYEPVSENFDTLKRVTSLYRMTNIRLFNEALGNSSGSLKMIMPVRGKARQQGLSKVYIPGSEEQGTIYDVPVKRLDDMYTGHEFVSSIKLDVENYEYEVLTGAKKLIQRSKPIVYCELWNNEKRSMVFHYMDSLEYGIYTFNSGKMSLDRIEVNYTGNSGNFFFLPEQEQRIYR